jgi:predicted permease
MNNLLQDVRYGLRMLRKSPSFALMAVLTLGLGVGATTAMFALLDAVLLRPLPFPASKQLVMIGPEWQGEISSLAPADFLDVRRDSRSFESVAGVRQMPFNMSGGERPERAVGAVVTADFFRVMRIEPFAGRSLTAADRNTRVAVLSYGLWQERFGGRQDVLGQSVTINAEPYTIVGIMPRTFAFPEGARLWAPARYQVPEHPLTPTVDNSTSRGMHYFDTVARLKPDVPLAAAGAEVAGIMKRIAQQNPGADAASGAEVRALQEVLVGETRPAILMLLAAVLLVFLVSCTNVANLLLARATTRRRELVIRRAMGAGLGRLAAQLITEAVIIAALGGMVGAIAAGWVLTGLSTLVPAEIREFVPLQIDPRVLGFTVLLSAIAGVLSGLAPLREAAAATLTGALKEDSRAGGSQNRLRSALVVAQTAFATVLLVVGGLLLQSFGRITSVSTGFQPQNLLTMRISLPETGYVKPEARAALVNAVLERTAALPGLASAAVASRLPLVPGGSARGVVLEGHTYTPEKPAENIAPDYITLSPGYFRTMQIPLARGRDFTAHDEPGAPPVAIVNQAMARAFWPGEDAVGKRLKVNDEAEWREVVAVCGDVRQRALDRAAPPTLFLPYAQDPWSFFSVVARTQGDPLALASAVEAAVYAVDPNEPVYDVRTYEGILGASVATRRLQMLLVAGFAGLGLLLAAIGLYSVIAYSVAQRTRELGVRLALGAQRGHILALVFGQGVRMTAIGLVLGAAAAAALGGWLRSLLFATAPLDPVTYGMVALVLCVVSLAACYVPARRAMRVDPLVALRYE